jgi:6-methylsalicylate decarboxylase
LNDVQSDQSSYKHSEINLSHDGLEHGHGSPAASIEMMNGHGIQAAMVSVASPGVYFGDAKSARELAHRCNEYSAGLVREHPDRFGVFASVPLASIDDAIAELRMRWTHLSVTDSC